MKGYRDLQISKMQSSIKLTTSRTSLQKWKMNLKNQIQAPLTNCDYCKILNSQLNRKQRMTKNWNNNWLLFNVKSMTLQKHRFYSMFHDYKRWLRRNLETIPVKLIILPKVDLLNALFANYTLLLVLRFATIPIIVCVLAVSFLTHREH